MEMGIGHHGEPGFAIGTLKSANEIASRMADVVLSDPGQAQNAEYAVRVAGLGATPINELYVLYDQIEKDIVAKGCSVYKTYVGNYFTSLEMVGASLTIMELDDELKQLLDAETNCVYF